MKTMKVLVLTSLILAVCSRPADNRVDVLKKELLQLDQDLAQYIAQANGESLEKIERVRADMVQLKDLLESSNSGEGPCPVGDEICILMREALEKGNGNEDKNEDKNEVWNEEEDDVEDIFSISETVAVAEADTIDVEDEDALAQAAVIQKKEIKHVMQVIEKTEEDVMADELLNQAVYQEEEKDVLDELAGVDEVVEESEREERENRANEAREKEAADNIIEMLDDTKNEKEIVQMSEGDRAALEMEKEIEAMKAMNRLINY